MVSILFHHSNLRLPLAFERILWKFVMTPRLHTIHHSNDPAEQSSNWSSGLTLWDRLHGTLRTTARDPIDLGVPGERSAQPLTLAESLTMPMRSRGQQDRVDGATATASDDIDEDSPELRRKVEQY